MTALAGRDRARHGKTLARSDGGTGGLGGGRLGVRVRESHEAVRSTRRGCDLVAFLVSDEAVFMSGPVVVIDGGHSETYGCVTCGTYRTRTPGGRHALGPVKEVVGLLDREGRRRLG